MPDGGEIKELLLQLDRAEARERQGLLDRLIPLVYGELKALARANRRRWAGEPAAGTTSLVHEAYAKLAGGAHDYPGRSQFFSLASKAMRSILIDNARHQSRLKRGGGVPPLPLDEQLLVSAERSDELLALDEALVRLEEHDPALAGVVECRCFGGLTIEDTAQTLGVSPATVKRRWLLARSWLYRELSPAQQPEPGGSTAS